MLSLPVAVRIFVFTGVTDMRRSFDGLAAMVENEIGQNPESVAAQSALDRQQWLGALRMPGRAEYLAALDDAVSAAVGGKQSPADALGEAAKRWQAITARLGLDRQRAAYRHGMGLE